jgi:hypothetical protein
MPHASSGWGGAPLESMYRLAGWKELAERVRPTQRAARGEAVGGEGAEEGEDGEPEEGEDEASEGDASTKKGKDNFGMNRASPTRRQAPGSAMETCCFGCGAVLRAVQQLPGRRLRHEPCQARALRVGE